MDRLSLALVAVVLSACGGNAVSEPPPPPPPPPLARLTVSGTQLLDPSGAPVTLRGWNWGQWGTMQPQDAADNVAQGANVVRIPLRWWGLYGSADIDARSDASPGHIDPAHLTLLDATIDAAIAQHLWVILFVDSNCGQASVANDTAAYCGTGSDGQPANFLNDADALEKFIQVWEFLAARYANKPYIGLLELLPEPQFSCGANGGCSDWTTAPRFYGQVIPRVRAVDARTPFLVGATGGYDLKKLSTAYMPGVANLVYTADILNGAAQTPSLVSNLTDFRTQHGVPVFVQQVGVRQSDTSAASVADTILATLNTAGVGWTWWTYREQHSAGQGYAPYWQDSGTTWNLNASWLQAISARLR